MTSPWKSPPFCVFPLLFSSSFRCNCRTYSFLFGIQNTILFFWYEKQRYIVIVINNIIDKKVLMNQKDIMIYQSCQNHILIFSCVIFCKPLFAFTIACLSILHCLFFLHCKSIITIPVNIISFHYCKTTTITILHSY